MKNKEIDLLKNIVEMATQAGAEVEVVGINQKEEEPEESKELPDIPLLKFELALSKSNGEIYAKAHASSHTLGEIFLQLMPFEISIEQVNGIFQPAFKKFQRCTDEVALRFKNEFERMLDEDEEERIRRKSC